jgi:hypothetical protein
VGAGVVATPNFASVAGDVDYDLDGASPNCVIAKLF